MDVTHVTYVMPLLAVWAILSLFCNHMAPIDLLDWDHKILTLNTLDMLGYVVENANIYWRFISFHDIHTSIGCWNSVNKSTVHAWNMFHKIFTQFCCALFFVVELPMLEWFSLYLSLHGANMGPTWVLWAPDGPHIGLMNLAIRVYSPGLLHSHWSNYMMMCQGHWQLSNKWMYSFIMHKMTLPQATLYSPVIKENRTFRAMIDCPACQTAINMIKPNNHELLIFSKQ